MAAFARFPGGIRGFSRGYFVPFGSGCVSWPQASGFERKRGPGLTQGEVCAPASKPSGLLAGARAVCC